VSTLFQILSPIEAQIVGVERCGGHWFVPDALSFPFG